MEFIIIILGIILDRITKIWALKYLALGNNVIIIPNFFAFSYLENRGAAFGILQNKLLFLVVITLIVLIGIVYYILKYKPTSNLLRIGLAFVISGAIGNLIDRVMYGFVVDFILLHYKNVYYFPTFNIADMLVSLGALLLAIYLIKEEIHGK
ncbi:lipoprotein signal peptidase [Clostridium acetireducens DSM 10703]|uniref:Lipoprotein signal peptidase n=1 Tax=Clostridium acetireducens DSM 10703 TaxID=1121290 RepID=A0A1E8F1R5_9CLOT|nr:signal peptidase II [Clostridium acetireducens]OFI07565.1 lipoprotein signal peptidase [Clostridium acetireducens DSM 10703]